MGSVQMIRQGGRMIRPIKEIKLGRAYGQQALYLNEQGTAQYSHPVL
jgi:hypothetical protein